MAEGLQVTVIDEQLQAKIQKAIKTIGDLRPAFLLIAQDWYKDNMQIFNLKSAGQYTDYKIPKGKSSRPTPYMIRKQQAVGFMYPLLKYSGKLMDSITNPSDANTVREITNSSMTLGTKDEKALYHQLGTQNMPARPPIINKAAASVANVFQARAKRYSRIVDTFVKKQMVKISRGEL